MFIHRLVPDHSDPVPKGPLAKDSGGVLGIAALRLIILISKSGSDFNSFKNEKIVM